MSELLAGGMKCAAQVWIEIGASGGFKRCCRGSVLRLSGVLVGWGKVGGGEPQGRVTEWWRRPGDWRRLPGLFTGPSYTPRSTQLPTPSTLPYDS